jgi:hypothetical protein
MGLGLQVSGKDSLLDPPELKDLLRVALCLVL